MKRFLSAGEGYAPGCPRRSTNNIHIYTEGRRYGVALLCILTDPQRIIGKGLLVAFFLFLSLALPVRAHFHEPSGLPVQQQTTLTGVVVDTAGRPMQGVNISIRGTRGQATTDQQGQFSLQTSATSGTLAASYIGYETVSKRFETGEDGPFRLVMVPAQQAIEEVEINAGYYTVKDRERTGSISRITAEEITRQPVTNPMAAMIGRMPGVDVVQTTGAPGGGFTIKIRGQNSLRSDGNDPLYIIDGVPVPAEQQLSNVANAIRPNNGPFGTFNPADIESIEVLKDADATAIYGSRGANGVVLVTTRRGIIGKPVSNFSVSHGVGQAGARMQLLNTEQYLEMRREAFANDGKQPGPADYDVNGTWNQNRYTDWQNELMGGTAHLSNIRYSISGGEARTRFLIGSGYSRETSILPTEAADHKATANFNIHHRSEDDRLSIQFSGNYSVNNANLPRLNPVRDALTTPPNAPAIYDSEGNLNWENGTWNNPFGRLSQGYKARTTALVANLIPTYTIMQGLQLKANVGYNEIRNNEHANQPKASFSPYRSVGSSAWSVHGDVQSWIVEPQLDFKRNLGSGVLSILTGKTFQESRSKMQNVSISGFSSDALLENPQAGSNIRISSVSDVQYRYSALFARINYNLLGRYILNVTGRRDGSSRFGPGRQFANFGAIGAAWIFSNETFAGSNIDFVNHGKLRASYGITGSDQVGEYGFYDIWTTGSYAYGGVTPLAPSGLFNPEYGWEENRKMEFGLEIGIWKDRINLEMNYYQNRSDNQLLAYALPSMTGFTSVMINLPADVQNRGLEMGIWVNWLKNDDVTWSSNLQLTLPRNKLRKYPNSDNASDIYSYLIGQSLDLYVGYSFLGVNPQNGLYDFSDLDADGRFTIGDYLATKSTGKQLYGGFNNSLTYKRFGFDIFFQFVNQNGMDYKEIFTSAPGRMTNQPVYVMDRWQKEGDTGDIQRFTSGPGDVVTRYGWRGDHNVVDASFFRLKNLSFRYRVGPEHNQYSSTLLLSGQNLALFTKYKGLDPENQSATLPPLRMISLGYELTF